ncbi:MAG: TaqI-like C-terminal specificity domain-containing protein, partial [Candidatus Heimdallarchaeaceae archaeon]
DHERAKQLKNNFQDIKYFKKKKIILCQHALRIRATIDQNGFICKDIFLIGHLNEKAKKYDVSLELILAMINSEFYSFLYKTMYSGTEIYAKYLHYLPMFLHDLPFVLPKREEIKELEKLVNKILHSKNTFFLELDSKIDNIIYKILHCSEEDKRTVKEVIKNQLSK